jgi:predicted DsbA family dithiol-disulfide isomerase
LKPVHLIVYSDYLCPWCYNVSVRMDRIREEFEQGVRIEWRSFLLRPRPVERDLEKFRRYTESWMKPAAEPDSGTFRVWQGYAGPPSHSLPPHRAAKRAADVGEGAFHAIHDRLLHAYFAENRDITDTATLREIWEETGLPPGAFEAGEDAAIDERIFREHEEALGYGATGAPAVRRADQEIAVTGAYPVELYRRWIQRALDEGAAARSTG